MKTPKQIKVITSQLEVLEEFKEQLETIIADINTVTLKGKSWIDDDSESQNFVEINLYLTNETSRCLRCYRDLTCDDFDQHSHSAEHSNQAENTSPKACNLSSKDDNTYQRFSGMVDKIESTLSKHSRKIKILKQKSLGHETKIKSTLLQIQESETQNNSKIEELIHELQGASQFMSSLQTQNTTFSNRLKENDEQILKLSLDYDDLLKINSQDVMAACKVRISDSEELHLNKETILTCFNSCLLNIGNCYNMNTGIFTVPCRGLYLCSLMMESENCVWAQFNIHVRRNGYESVRGTTHTNSTGAVACLVTVIELKQGDEVYIKAANDVAVVKLNLFSYFVVVLLRQNKLEPL